MTHEKTVLQQISDVAWLVHQGQSKIGILNKDVQEHYTYITGKEIVKFDDKEDVVDHFGNLKLFEDQLTASAITLDKFYIKGFEVDYPTPFVIDELHPAYRNDIPLFTKIEGSDVYYAAGYYCINFEKGWKGGNGCKLTTLERYGYEGPFKTEQEMRMRLRDLNKRKRHHDRV